MKYSKSTNAFNFALTSRKNNHGNKTTIVFDRKVSKTQLVLFIIIAMFKTIWSLVKKLIVLVIKVIITTLVAIIIERLMNGSFYILIILPHKENDFFYKGNGYIWKL